MFEQMEQDGVISTRGLKPDAVKYGELVFDVNSAYFYNHGGYEFAKQFYADAYKVAAEIVGGEQYILSAVMHADERNRAMSEALGEDVYHYHLHVVYIPVVEKQILWSKRCKDEALRGTVKEVITQVSRSKKWESKPVLGEDGNPMLNAKGKKILKSSYSVLQDDFFNFMRNAGYLYTRVSTSMQVDGYSLDAQRDKLRKYAAYEDMIVAGEYSDEGFSGKNIQGRQEFQRMLNDIQDGKDDVSYVLVFKLSRFGRNAADVLNSLQLMQDFGVNLICVEDGIDSSKDAGKLMISVLSAVAEIERENIRTQTMAGREQKAREGKWNGGFAPYGYKLENGNLVIAEDEVEVIRVIYDRYIHTNEGVAGVAKYLNRNGYTKKLRQNNTIPGFSRDFVKNVLYNPVYMGKIAYGRRRTEKKQGTRNEMHVVEQSEFPVYEGQHEAIISEEDWYLAQEKRKINSFKREKVNNPDHAHILSGILKCPCCGKSMYGNIAKAHSKDKKTRYYYYCKNTVTPTGHECSFRLNIEQTEINKFVAKVISAMVNNPRFVEAIQAKIGTAVDTEDMERQIAVLQGRLKQAFGTKSRLERQMDTLDINDAHYDRKILDLQRRYDEQYDTIEEIEVQIGELQSQIRSIQQEKISGDNIYRLLLAFDEVYHSATEAEQKEFMKAFIERIEMFPEKRKDGSWIKKIVFNFPVPVDGEEVKELPLETETTVEAVCLLTKE